MSPEKSANLLRHFETLVHARSVDEVRQAKRQLERELKDFQLVPVNEIATASPQATENE